MAKIKTITYKRLINLGDYSNETVDVTVEVEPTESPSEVLKHVRYWLNQHLGRRALAQAGLAGHQTDDSLDTVEGWHDVDCEEEGGTPIDPYSAHPF